MTDTQNAPASQRQQLVEVAGIPGYMGTKTGGEIEADISKAWDGGANQPETLSAPAETSDVVVTKMYRSAIHKPILDQWAKQVGSLRTTVSVFDTDPDLGPIGQPTVYAGAILRKLVRPEYDASSSDPGMFELTFAVNGEA